MPVEGAGTADDPFRIVLSKSSRHLRSSSCRLDEPQAFDIGACRDADLMSIVLDGAAAAGWPFTKSLYAWAGANKDLRQCVHAIISPMLANMSRCTEQWRKAVVVHKAATLRLEDWMQGIPDLVEMETPEGFTAEFARRDLLRDKREEAKDASAAAQTELEMAINRLVSNAATTRIVQIQAEAWDDSHQVALRNTLGKDRTSRRDGFTDRKSLWRGFHYDWMLMAHVCLEQCMACSGLKIRCTHRILNTDHPLHTAHMGDFCFPCSQAGVVLYAKEQCLEWQTVTPWPEGAPQCDDPTRSPLDAHDRKVKGREGRARFVWAGMLAKAMLNVKGMYQLRNPKTWKYFLPAQTRAEEPPDSAHAWTSVLRMRGPKDWIPLSGNAIVLGKQSLFVCYNRYIPVEDTLAGRLGLTAEEVASAEAQARRCIAMRDEEEKAIAKARYLKQIGDVDVYIQRKLPGETLPALIAHFPTVRRSLERMLTLAEYSMKNLQCGPTFALKYRDAMEDNQTRRMIDRLLYGVQHLAKEDQWAMGESKGHTAEAYEWILNLTTGAFPGESGNWRNYLDWSTHKTKEHGDMPEKEAMLLEVAALHLFDKLSSPEWSLGVVIEPVVAQDESPGSVTDHLQWELYNKRTGMRIRDNIPTRAYSCLKEWHTMVTECFNSHSSSTSGMQLPRVPPTKQTYEQGVEFHRPLTKGGLRCIEETQRYFMEMSGTCTLFAETRHAGLLLLGIVPQRVVNLLREFHHDWSRGLTVPMIEAPQCLEDFLLWFVGNPTKKHVSWIDVPKRSFEAANDGPAGRQAATVMSVSVPHPMAAQFIDFCKKSVQRKRRRPILDDDCLSSPKSPVSVGPHKESGSESDGSE